MERIEVRHHQVEEVDSVTLSLSHMRWVRLVGEQSTVDLRVQRDHPMIEDRWVTGDVGDVGHGQAGIGQHPCSTAR